MNNSQEHFTLINDFLHQWDAMVKITEVSLLYIKPSHSGGCPVDDTVIRCPEKIMVVISISSCQTVVHCC